MQKHVKAMVEIFDALAAADNPVEEEDRVVYLLTSLPESYKMLVTALEANAEVPKMEIVTEHLLHEESKLKERAGEEKTCAKVKALASQHWSRGKGPKCHHCAHFGHIKRNCRDLKSESNSRESQQSKPKNKAYKTRMEQRDSSSSDSCSIGMVVSDALSASSNEEQDSWIVESGATCHICNDKKLFVELCSLEEPEEVTLWDGYAAEATGRGVVALEVVTISGKTKKWKLHEVLYVPNIAYNLLSVSRVTNSVKAVKFSEAGCEFHNENRELIGTATRVGRLYYLNCRRDRQQMNAAADLWHRRYRHL